MMESTVARIFESANLLIYVSAYTHLKSREIYVIIIIINIKGESNNPIIINPMEWHRTMKMKDPVSPSNFSILKDWDAVRLATPYITGNIKLS